MKLGEWCAEHRKALIAGGAAALVALAVAAGMAASSARTQGLAIARARLADAKYPLEPLVDLLRGLGSLPQDMQPEVEKRLKFELAALRVPLEKAVRPEEFRAVDRLLGQIETLCPAVARQVESARGYRAAREEAVEFRALEELVARDRPYAEAARAFVAKWPKCANLARVQGWQSRAAEQVEAKDRAELDQFNSDFRRGVYRHIVMSVMPFRSCEVESEFRTGMGG